MNDSVATLMQGLLHPDSQFGKEVMELLELVHFEIASKSPIGLQLTKVLDAASKRSDPIWENVGMLEKEAAMLTLNSIRAQMGV